MPVIQGKTVVPPKTSAAWVDTDGSTNIAIGVSQHKHARIEYTLGGTDVYGIDPSNFNPHGAIVAKAAQVRVTNIGGTDISFEVFE